MNIFKGLFKGRQDSSVGIKVKPQVREKVIDNLSDYLIHLIETDEIDMVFKNLHMLEKSAKVCDSFFNIKLPNGLVLLFYKRYNSSTDFIFTYKGSIILVMNIVKGGLDPIIRQHQISCYLPEKSSDCKTSENTIFDFTMRNKIPVINSHFNNDITFKTVVKCWNSLYKTALVKDKIRHEQFILANQERDRQKELKLKLQMDRLKDFADNFID